MQRFRAERLPLATAALALACGVITLAGCGRSTSLDSTYGRSRGASGTAVNGTSVLAQMFRQQGKTVSTWRRLSPKLENEDVIVWFPDTFDVPSQEEIDYLEAWLADGPNRTLVYVGRDYDAALHYWRSIIKETSGVQRLRVREQLARLESEHVVARQQLTSELTCDWFTLYRDAPVRPVEELSGEWSESINRRNADVWLGSRMELPAIDSDSEDEWIEWDEVNSLLEGDGQVLAAELRQAHWPSSQLILVNNGSWLVNMPLVNPAHRILASELIAACEPAQRVCFLESGVHGLSISETDNELPLLLKMFTVPPMDIVMLHVTFLGILYCFSVMPIFGRPRRLPDDSTTDFGKHVAAVGDLLERGRDTAYAQHQLEHYRNTLHPK